MLFKLHLPLLDLGCGRAKPRSERDTFDMYLRSNAVVKRRDEMAQPVQAHFN